MDIKNQSGRVILTIPGDTLYGADLRGANLRRADLRRANLYGAVWYDCNLDGAIITHQDKKIKITFTVIE